MTNAELAEHLNAEIGLTGRNAITANVIRQWVLWDVLPRAQANAKGRGRAIEWGRDVADMHRARRLAELRRYGVVRKTAIVAQAWLELDYPDFCDAKKALLVEFRRARSVSLRDLTSSTEHDAESPLSQTRRNALLRQSGPLDPRLEKTSFQLPPQSLVRILDAAVSGKSHESDVAEIISEQFYKFDAPVGNKDIHDFSLHLAKGFSGLLGDPDEIGHAGEQTLVTASVGQFSLARRIWRKGYFRIPEHFQNISEISEHWSEAGLFQSIYQKIGPSILVGQWAVFSFAGILHSVANFRKNLPKNTE
jgi:hypothetical protein